MVAAQIGILPIMPMTLAPGEYALVVSDETAFEAAYGTGFPIAGAYTGQLDNAGERIELQDAVGQTVLDFQYEDGWYRITDREAFSLTIMREGKEPKQGVGYLQDGTMVVIDDGAEFLNREINTKSKR